MWRDHLIEVMKRNGSAGSMKQKITQWGSKIRCDDLIKVMKRNRSAGFVRQRITQSGSNGIDGKHIGVYMTMWREPFSLPLQRPWGVRSSLTHQCLCEIPIIDPDSCFFVVKTIEYIYQGALWSYSSMICSQCLSLAPPLNLLHTPWKVHSTNSRDF